MLNSSFYLCHSSVLSHPPHVFVIHKLSFFHFSWFDSLFLCLWFLPVPCPGFSLFLGFVTSVYYICCSCSDQWVSAHWLRLRIREHEILTLHDSSLWLLAKRNEPPFHTIFIPPRKRVPRNPDETKNFVCKCIQKYYKKTLKLMYLN